MDAPPFQDLVDWECYGCGRLNERGLRIRSTWDGDDVVCRWRPELFHVGLPGRLQGGVLTTAIICHALWTATATALRNEGRPIQEPLDTAYSTMSVKVDFLAPTPLDGEVTLRARVTSFDGERATVATSATVGDVETARAETMHVRVPLR
jgi:predicted thioesterase